MSDETLWIQAAGAVFTALAAGAAWWTAVLTRRAVGDEIRRRRLEPLLRIRSLLREALFGLNIGPPGRQIRDVQRDVNLLIPNPDELPYCLGFSRTDREEKHYAELALDEIENAIRSGKQLRV